MFCSPPATSTPNRPCALGPNALASRSPLHPNIPTFEPANPQTIPSITPLPTNLDAASSISPLFATLTENTRGGGYIFQSKFFSFRNLTTLHSLLVYPQASRTATISFRIRTSAKRARNPRRIRTSKTQHLKPFRMNTYEKRGRGVTSFKSKSSLAFSGFLLDRCPNLSSRAHRGICFSVRGLTDHGTWNTGHVLFTQRAIVLRKG
jgi:hypothetical protein